MKCPSVFFTETAQRFRQPDDPAGEPGGERSPPSAGDRGHQRAPEAEGEAAEGDRRGHAQLLPCGRAQEEIRAGGARGCCGGGEVPSRRDEEDAGGAGAAESGAEEERGGAEEENAGSDAVSDL